MGAARNFILSKPEPREKTLSYAVVSILNAPHARRGCFRRAQCGSSLTVAEAIEAGREPLVMPPKPCGAAALTNWTLVSRYNAIRRRGAG
jgi:hypothetical protein